MSNFLYKGLFVVLFCFLAEAGFTQTIATTKKDGRIIATIKDVSIPKPLSQYVKVADPFQLMSSFDIRMQWWTLLSEPIEKYDFTWYSTGKFVLGNRTITKGMLQKYPDLLKRFNNIEPIEVWVFVEGDMTGKTLSVKRGELPSSSLTTNRLSSYKKNGQSYDRYSTSGEFIYLIDQLKILPSKSGQLGDGIVGESPHWNEFLFWDDGSSAFNRNIYEKGNRSDNALLKSNKLSFDQIDKVTLTASLHKVEWPEYELQSIAETYDKYENGELKPEDSSDELNNLLSGGDESGCGDDLNAMLSGCGEEKAIEFDIVNRDGKEGVVAKDGRILIPFKDWDISSFDPKTRLAQVIKSVGTRSKSGFCDKTFKVEIKEVSTVDASGSSVIPEKFYAEYPAVTIDISNVITLGTRRVNETASERRARERRKAQREREKREAEERSRRCDEQNEPVLDAFKKELMAESIDVSEL